MPPTRVLVLSISITILSIKRPIGPFFPCFSLWSAMATTVRIVAYRAEGRATTRALAGSEPADSVKSVGCLCSYLFGRMGGVSRFRCLFVMQVTLRVVEGRPTPS